MLSGKDLVLEGFFELDKAFAGCFRRAKENGELPDGADPAVLAQLASATLHTLAIRARAGVPRKELEAIVKGAIEMMAPAKPSVARFASRLVRLAPPRPEPTSSAKLPRSCPAGACPASVPDSRKEPDGADTVTVPAP